MSQKNRTILVTSALPYANGPIHIGHMVEYIQTDIWARFQRSQGHECYFAWADDAHGTPVMLWARAEGKTPEEALAKLKERREAATLQLESLKADKKAIVFGKTSFSTVWAETPTTSLLPPKS